ncbi:MAG: Rpn family recombination-promoting nuclease/putative transposase [Lachnospiraceae bacterium]|nr:Rpn family recombination-promoting nuclease/putative transposase [Lachnospiraceae bacterium]
MLSIVDFCFKELMQNGKVRQGFIASLLAVKPETVEETELLPTILPQEYEDDKQGILDVRVKLVDGTQMDFEMQVASFDYWEKRIPFYLSRMYTEQLKKGNPTKSCRSASM